MAPQLSLPATTDGGGNADNDPTNLSPCKPRLSSTTNTTHHLPPDIPPISLVRDPVRCCAARAYRSRRPQPLDPRCSASSWHGQTLAIPNTQPRVLPQLAQSAFDLHHCHAAQSVIFIVALFFLGEQSSINTYLAPGPFLPAQTQLHADRSPLHRPLQTTV